MKKLKFKFFGKPQKSFSFLSTGNITEDFQKYNELKAKKENTLILGGPGSGKGRYLKKPNDIILFLLGEPVGINNKALDIETVWLYNHTQLERGHNYIQWLFPLNEASDYNPSALVLTKQDIQIIRNNPIIQSNLVHSFELMLEFYGFALNRETITVEQTQQAKWLLSHHNYLRITRILKSLTLCGLNQYAVAFYQALMNVKDLKDTLPDITLNFWENAVFKKNEDNPVETIEHEYQRLKMEPTAPVNVPPHEE